MYINKVYRCGGLFAVEKFTYIFQRDNLERYPPMRSSCHSNCMCAREGRKGRSIYMLMALVNMWHFIGTMFFILLWERIVRYANTRARLTRDECYQFCCWENLGYIYYNRQLGANVKLSIYMRVVLNFLQHFYIHITKNNVSDFLN